MFMSAHQHNPLRLIGAFAPSTSYLADAMTKIVEAPQVFNILEVGAGTGAITKTLAKKMRPSQRADVVEIFPALFSLLNKRFSSTPSMHIHCSDIMHFQPERSYDLIISSLPFNAFMPELTQAVIDHLITLAKPGCYMSFFEYRILQGLMPWVMPAKKFAQFQASRAIIERFIKRYKIDETSVYRNFPPAVVHHVRIDK